MKLKARMSELQRYSASNSVICSKYSTEHKLFGMVSIQASTIVSLTWQLNDCWLLLSNQGLEYRVAGKFHGVKLLRKLIQLSFRDFIFMDSDPTTIIDDVNIVSRIKIFMDGDKSVKTAKILPSETF